MMKNTLFFDDVNNKHPEKYRITARKTYKYSNNAREWNYNIYYIIETRSFVVRVNSIVDTLADL